ncbi:hypothetical protein [Paenibacillus sp.]|uniref:hypothetical protein n=1 Tax=Paenibacillus sp. TaxID=58172 RepID=UPI0035635656
MAIIRLREPRELLSQGEYHAQISGVTTLNDVETKFGPKKMMKVTFTVSYNGKTQTVSERYNVSTHPDSNMSRLLRVFYEDIPDELDTDMLIGRVCRVVIEHRTLSDGTPWNGVKEVLPPQQVTTASEPSTAAANNNAVVRAIRPRPSLAEAAARRARRDNLPVTDASPIFEVDQPERQEE